MTGRRMTSLRQRLDPHRITAGAPVLPLAVLFGLSVVDELDANAYRVLLPEIKDYFDLSLAGIATISALSTPVAILLAVPIAHAADRYRRTRIAAGGAAVWGLFSALTGLATNVFTLGLARAGSRLGKAAIGPTHKSLLSDYYPVSTRVPVFTAHDAADSVGQTIAPLLVGLMAFLPFFTWRLPFLVFAIPTLVLAVIVVTKLHDPIRGYWDRRAAGSDERVASTEEQPASFREAWRIVMAVPTMRRIFLAMPLLAMVRLGAGSFVPVMYDEVFGVGVKGRSVLFAFEAPVELAGLLLFAPVATRVARQDPARLLRLISRVGVVVAASIAVFAVAPTLWVAVPADFAAGAFAGMLLPGINACLSLCIPPRVRSVGFTVGAVFTLLGLPMLPVFGLLGDTFGIRTALLLVAPVIVIATRFLASAGRFVNADIDDARIAARLRAEDAARRDEGSGVALRISGLRAGYGPNVVLPDLDLEVRDGEIVALLGTNGAGKSTLLKTIAGLVRCERGAIVHDGHDITFAGPRGAAVAGIVLMPGGSGVFPGLGVGENIELATWLRHTDATLGADIEAMLDRHPFLRERWLEPASNLSGGQQQILTLVQALLGRPKLLLIDELTLGLSPVVVADLLELVAEVNRAGTTVIVVEQSVNVALALAERAVFLEKGAIRYDGPAVGLRDVPGALRAVYLPSAADVSARERAEPTAAASTNGASASVLEARNVSVSFGALRALDDVSLSVAPGAIVGLLGPNGAGKTTALDVLSGFVPPDQGTVQFRGADVTGWPPARRARHGLGRLFQDARLFPTLTVAECIAVAADRHVEVPDLLATALGAPAVRESEAEVRLRVDAAIDALGLGALREERVGALSTGQRRVVDLACAVALAPDVLLLDEPAAGLAQAEVEALVGLVHDVRHRTGAAMVIVEHDVPFLTAVADELVAFDLGAVVVRGRPHEVVADDRVLRSFLGRSDVAWRRSGAPALG